MQPSARYEGFVADLAKTINSHRDISDVGFGLRNHSVGSSGVRHQIDVSFVDRSSSPHTLVVIECKYLNRPVKLAYVKVLKATIDDLAQFGSADIAIKGILVSLHGAQQGAIKYAAHYNIDLQLVSDGSFYRFKYADLELVASYGTATSGSHVTGHGVALRACKSCGLHFKSYGTSEICQSCAVPNNG